MTIFVSEQKLKFIFLIPFAALLILFGLQFAKSRENQTSEYLDSFEESRINSKYWSTTWWVARQSGIVEGVAQDGSSSLKAVVEPGNRRLYGKSGQATERCELLEKRRHVLGTDLWYTFSVYVPQEFPVEDVRLVMGQWKQTSWTLYKKHSPVIAQRFRNGIFSITINNDSGQHLLYETGTIDQPALIGEWSEFKYHIRFSKENAGILEVWINGEQVVDYEGQLAYSDDMNTSYFRLGLYRDTMQVPMVVYFDDFQLISEGVK